MIHCSIEIKQFTLKRNKEKKQLKKVIFGDFRLSFAYYGRLQSRVT